MAIDFSHYNPPGVYTNPLVGQQIAVNSSLPQAVGLIGVASGYQNYVETIQINPDTLGSTPLPSASRNLTMSGIGQNTLDATASTKQGRTVAGSTPSLGTMAITVRNISTGQPYNVSTNGTNGDYTVDLVSGTINTPAAVYAISRVIGGAINPGDYVQVSYSYTDANYFNPKLFYDFQDVATVYGQPFDVAAGVQNGVYSITSELTLGARFAFLNGASMVQCVAVQPTGGTPTSPVAGVGDYQAALDLLKDDPLIAVVVSCGSHQEMNQWVAEHVYAQSQTGFERRGILSLDGTSVSVPYSSRITAAHTANGYTDTGERLLMVSPATFNYFAPELSNSIVLGGQFMAAALAGLTVSQSFAEPLTRKIPVGFTDTLDSGLREQDGQKSLESQNGLCVVEKNRQQIIQVRHGVTVNYIGDITKREWSIVGQQDALIYRLRDYLNAAGLIGRPIYPYTLINVKAAAESALQSLLRDGLMVDYTALKVRQLLTNPDVLEVTFQWLPAFPLNYIVVSFSISLTSGNITSAAGANTQSNTTNATQVSNTSALGTPTATSTNDFGGSSNTLQST